MRLRIAFETAGAIAYLHSSSVAPIYHRDIKSTNILLDENFESHVGDFGLAKVVDMPQSKSVSAIAGSYGYIAPGKLLFSWLFISCQEVNAWVNILIQCYYILP